MKYLRLAVERTIFSGRVQLIPNTVITRVVRLKSLLSTQREQIAIILKVLMSNTNTIEVDFTNVKDKYKKRENHYEIWKRIATA